MRQDYKPAYRSIKIRGFEVTSNQHTADPPTCHKCHIILSGIPPAQWIEFFKEEIKQNGLSHVANPVVEDSFVVVNYQSENYRELLQEMKRDIINANLRFLRWLEPDKSDTLFNRLPVTVF